MRGGWWWKVPVVVSGERKAADAGLIAGTLSTPRSLPLVNFRIFSTAISRPLHWHDFNVYNTHWLYLHLQQIYGVEYNKSGCPVSRNPGRGAFQMETGKHCPFRHVERGNCTRTRTNGEWCLVYTLPIFYSLRFVFYATTCPCPLSAS